ncbi:antitoxin MazE-like protein [Paraburkholderia phymatum]|uniref:Antitoxin MazE-like protein n=1 Tax=Paraburkholderia phymatum TaxID=148447 RepID=A0ACC6U5K2_9BURK
MPNPPDLRKSPYADGLPDTSDPEFIKEIQRQSRVIAESPGEKELMDFIEEASRDAWD